MNTPKEPAMRKAYHRPEIKDYGTISKLTAGSQGGRGDSFKLGKT